MNQQFETFLGTVEHWRDEFAQNEAEFLKNPNEATREYSAGMLSVLKALAFDLDHVVEGEQNLAGVYLLLNAYGDACCKDLYENSDAKLSGDWYNLQGQLQILTEFRNVVVALDPGLVG